tara:strand:+ start:3188 stop:3580 length:393 start_codon:yes stop_codon:yes gene_type:complete
VLVDRLLKQRSFKFVSVGLLATLVHALIFLIFLEKFRINEQISNLIGFIFAFIVSYTGQRKWTFSERIVTHKIKSQVKFFLSSLLSLILNMLWVYITVHILGLHASYATLGMIFITPIIIYMILNYWVFI